MWKDKIKKGKDNLDIEAYQSESARLKEMIHKNKPSSILSFFRTKTSAIPKEPTPVEIEMVEIVSTTPEPEVNESTDENEAESSLIETVVDCTKEPIEEPVCPAQDKLREEIASKKDILTNLYESKHLVMDAESSKALEKRIKVVTAEKEVLEKKLKKKISDQKAKKKQRKNEKETLDDLKVTHPEIASSLKLRDGVGRPQIECDQSDLLEDILKIATIGAACGDKRREDIFRTVKTLDDLHKAICALGYRISRSALYLRLLPRQASTNQGKKHVNTVNVKLVRPQNNLRKGHPDRIFAAESFKAVDEIASFLGPGAAVYISQDDKSSVPLGVIAAKKQSAILMNMRVRLRLPDHDFKVGSRHLLTPSVIAVCTIDPKVGVTYTGPTYVAVRSAKHNGSTAYSHNEDLKHFAEVESEVFKKEGSVSEYKPVWFKGVDGGPDENPRFEKNIVMGCKTFKDFDLDCLIEVTNAPGLSAYNRAERRMYHLSKELTGVVLPYDQYGSHLDASGKTIDSDLEIKNFEAAGGVLADLWSNMEIDGHKVTSEFVAKAVKEDTVEYKVSPAYRSKHVLETQYMTVFLKCDDRSCCTAPKTMIETFFPGRRIPTLIPVRLSPSGPVALDLEKEVFKKEIAFPNIFARVVLESQLAPKALIEKYDGKIPYDAYFPTQQEKVEGRTCTKCNKYHASKKSLKLHMKSCLDGSKRKQAQKTTRKKRQKLPVTYIEEEVEEINSEDVVREGATESFEIVSDDEEEVVDLDEDVQPGCQVSVPNSGTFETILNLKEWIKHAWTEI